MLARNGINGTQVAGKKRKINWVNVGWLIGSPIAAVSLVTYHMMHHGFQPWAWIAFLVSWPITALSITAGYHRLISHRSYSANKFLKLVYLIVGATAFEGSALEWATDHRRHHRQVDTTEDPYNINQGFFHAHIGWLFWKESNQYPLPPDLKNDPLIMWQDRYFVPLAIGVGLLLPCFIGGLFGQALAGFAYVGFLRVVFCQHATFLINSACHCFGRQPYYLKNSARDSMIMAFFACGEGYHNFHHRFQTDYRNGFRWYHWDPAKWVIRSAALVGWASNLKRVPDPVILNARMQIDHVKLVERGAPVEKLYALKTRVEEAQLRWREIKEDYRRVKRNVQVSSRRKVIAVKAELRVAKLEFKMACAQWYAYCRTFKTARAYSRGIV